MVSRAIFTYICYIRVGRAIRFLFLTIGSLAEVLCLDIHTDEITAEDRSMIIRLPLNCSVYN